ncbi:MAG: DUF1559 domain-containing protein [Planctomycetaceae bacterium]|nr:DUF1559 domain-containing protein [Planctomycetaceae bacterium]
MLNTDRTAAASSPRSFLRERPPRGVSTVEVVVAFCAMLLCATLLLEAVQLSREASRRQTCENNLKRLGLACHNYHDVYGGFPPGWVQIFRQADGTPGYGWLTALLPYVEQANLYNQIDINRMPDKPTPILQMAIRTYRCPSDPTELTNSLRGDFGTSNYSGNCGSDSLPSWAPSPIASFWPGSLDSPEIFNGMFWQNRNISMRHIVDGTSHTFLAGERSLTSASGIWPGVRSNKNASDLVTDCSAGNEPNSGRTSFSSMHPGGVNFLMCDGSIRYVNNNIDSRSGEAAAMGTYQRLANREDGQVIDGF